MPDIYADTFTNIAVTGNIVRIELGSLVPPAANEQEPRFVSQQRLIMPMEGFLRAFGMAEQVMQKMVADGIVQKREPQPAAAAAVAAPEPGAGGEADTSSPNFH